MTTMTTAAITANATSIRITVSAACSVSPAERLEPVVAPAAERAGVGRTDVDDRKRLRASRHRERAEPERRLPAAAGVQRVRAAVAQGERVCSGGELRPADLDEVPRPLEHGPRASNRPAVDRDDDA